MIKVSVIIPAYNIERYIDRCLQSIINQTLKDIEIIVINDGSMDNTEKIIKKHFLKDNRIKLISTINQGVSVARNIGIAKANGKYIYQIDGDDFLEPTGLKEMYEFAEKQQADVVITNAYRNNSGNLTNLLDGDSLSDDYVHDFLYGKILPSVTTKLYRRDFLKSNNIVYPKNIRIGEDVLFNLEVVAKAESIVKLEKAFLHYVKRSDSITNSYNNEILDIFYVFNQMKKVLLEKGIYNIYKEVFEYYKFFHIYMLRVVNSSKIGPIHKEIYDRYRIEKPNRLENSYVNNYLKETRFITRIMEYSYSINYSLGIFNRKLLDVLKGNKFLSDIINELRNKSI